MVTVSKKLLIIVLVAVFVGCVSTFIGYRNLVVKNNNLRAENEQLQLEIIALRLGNLASDLSAIKQPLIDKLGADGGARVDELLGRIEKVEEKLSSVGSK